MNRLHSGGPLAVSAAAGGGEAHPGGAGRAGRGRGGPLNCHPRQGVPHTDPTTCLGTPAPSKVLLQPRAPEPPPHTSPRTSAVAELAAPSARAQPRVWLQVGRAPRASRTSHPRDLAPAVGAPPEPTNLGRGRAREPPSPPYPRAHLSCQGPAAPPRLTHAGATVARVCLNCLSHPGLCGGGSAARGGGASGAWAKKHLLLSPLRTHPSATPPTPRPRLAPGALTSAGGRCRVSAASARARTDGPPGAPSAVTARRVGAAPALLATPAGQSRGTSSRLRGPLISKSREEWLTTRLPYPSLKAASPSAWNSAWHLATH